MRIFVGLLLTLSLTACAGEIIKGKWHLYYPEVNLAKFEILMQGKVLASITFSDCFEREGAKYCRIDKPKDMEVPVFNGGG